MEKSAIEKKDLELLRKIEEIRKKKLQKKDEIRLEDRKAFGAGRVIIGGMVLGIIFFVIATIWIGSGPDDALNGSRDTDDVLKGGPVASGTNDTIFTPDIPPQPQEADLPQHGTVTEEVITLSATPLHRNPDEKILPDVPLAEGFQEETTAKSTRTPPDDLSEEDSRIAQQAGLAVEEQRDPDRDVYGEAIFSAQGEEHSGISVSKISACEGIRNRKPYKEASVFSAQKNRSMAVWTEIRATLLPQTIKHVYYINGEKYCEVPLDVKYPRTRTWSRVRLRGKGKVGKWTVNVVDSAGEILGQKSFEVSL